MRHTLEVPDALYETLELLARRGQTPEDLLLAALRQLVQGDAQTGPRRDQSPAPDPIAPFIGAFTFGIGDLAERHDTYLAEELGDRRDAAR